MRGGDVVVVVHGDRLVSQQVETILYQQSLTTLHERGALVGDAQTTAYVYTGVVVLGSSLAEEILRCVP